MVLDALKEKVRAELEELSLLTIASITGCMGNKLEGSRFCQ
jgi:hypothetical protein